MMTGKEKYLRRYARHRPAARKVRWYNRPPPPAARAAPDQVFTLPGRGGFVSFATPWNFLASIFQPRVKQPPGVRAVELKPIGVGRGGIPMYREIPKKRGKEYPRRAQ